jgi:hypothetical protein
MFLAYCLNPVDQSWTPAVHLKEAVDCFTYCFLHYRWSPEIRVTDEEDFVVLHVENGILKIPQPDQSLRELPIDEALIARFRQQ